MRHARAFLGTHWRFPPSPRDLLSLLVRAHCLARLLLYWPSTMFNGEAEMFSVLFTSSPVALLVPRRVVQNHSEGGLVLGLDARRAYPAEREDIYPPR